MKKAFKVYWVDNIRNDKIYVGQTERPLWKRLTDHKYAAKTSTSFKSHFYNAIKHHGPSSFRIHELGEYPTREEMNNAERLWILLLRSYDPETGYNATLGGDRNWDITEDTRLKLRESHLGHEGPLKGQKRPDWVVQKLRGPRPKWRGENSGSFKHHVPTERILELKKQGTGNYEIARLLGVHPCTVYNRLKGINV